LVGEGEVGHGYGDADVEGFDKVPPAHGHKDYFPRVQYFFDDLYILEEGETIVVGIGEVDLAEYASVVVEVGGIPWGDDFPFLAPVYLRHHEVAGIVVEGGDGSCWSEPEKDGTFGWVGLEEVGGKVEVGKEGSEGG
jgi:hypothetical protein